jgi:primosomal protein N' (replication factor Y) (superfamily II helicase)
MDTRQGELFSSDIPEWELDAASSTPAALIAFSEPPFGPFHYRIPDELAGTIQPGMRVKVPLGKGNREMVGYCLAIEVVPQVASRLKPILESLDLQPLCTGNLLKLVDWMSRYYITPIGQVFEAIIPAGVRTQAGTRMKTLLTPAANFAFDPDRDSSSNASSESILAALPTKQRHVLQQLILACEPLTVEQLQKMSNCSSAPIQSLRDRGLIEARSERVMEGEDSFSAASNKLVQPPALTADQRLALVSIREALDSSKHQTLLLHGITGSGKTEVYMQAIEHTLTFGRQSIVLVPEISLTPQTRQRFQDRFGAVAVMHSHMSGPERHHQWRRISEGAAKVVVGARSAIFAPVPHLGLIILDEEHENSFKQNNIPRYHARDVAIHRAWLEQIPLVLGSATPSLETYHRAVTGKYKMLNLPRRIHNRPLPEVTIVDMRHERIDPNRGSLSKPLHEAMKETLRAGGQIILMLNRRGFATTIQCPACGYVVSCPDCDLPLTHHHDGSKAVCHYCDYTIATPRACPQCRSPEVRYTGSGTQRLEIEIAKGFPNSPLARMDADSMKKPGSHERTLSDFRNGKTKILLGTQMIAKGLDFPNVLLVGVINADSALHFPDFRAAERTFQLVTQVAGRSGRGEKPGHVFVQTYSPDHPAIELAREHDFLSFAKQELEHREKFQYPPFGSVARIIIRGLDPAVTEAFANSITQTVEKIRALQGSTQVRFLGPAVPPLAKLKTFYRFHILFVAEEPGILNRLLTRVHAELKPPKDVEYVIDIDPVDML